LETTPGSGLTLKSVRIHLNEEATNIAISSQTAHPQRNSRYVAFDGNLDQINSSLIPRFPACSNNIAPPLKD
jgi:hypothetical protein